MSLKNVYPYLLLLIIVLAGWVNYIDLNLLSEDYLVLSYHKSIQLNNIFDVLFVKNVGGNYWRPVTYLTYRIIEFFSPENVLLHRCMSLFLYYVLTVLIYKAFLKLNISVEISFLTSALFASMYNHEYQLGWIPGRTDILMSIFLLLSFIFLIDHYRKSKRSFFVFSLFTMALAILSKEHAIVGCILPIFAGFFLKGRIKKQYIVDSLIYSFIVVLIFFYRIFYIGGDPFSSQNFSDISIFEIMRNFVAYTFLVFIRPEELEKTFYLFTNNIPFLIILLSIGLGILYFILRNFFKTPNKKVYYLGVAWFVIFISPALLTLMRWYVFMPSIGIFIMIAYFLEDKNNKFNKSIILIFILINIILANVRYNDWSEASNKTQYIVENIDTPNDGIDFIYFWGIPDKYNRVNTLKIAPNVMIANAIDFDQEKIYFPIKSEIYDNSDIEIYKKDNSINIKLINGRLIPKGSSSTVIFKAEYFSDSTENYSYIIKNEFINDIFVSNAYINLKNNSKILNYYFDGEKAKTYKK